MSRFSWLGLALALGAVSVGCGGGGDNDVPGDPDAAVAADAGDEPLACTATIEARAAEVADQISGWSIADAPEMIASAGSQNREADYAGKYRDDLASHPGCVARASYEANSSEPLVSDNETTVSPGTPIDIAGYSCAAKEYTQAAEDTSKPIVILFHGNSSGVTTYENYFNSALAGTTLQNYQGFEFTADTAMREQLASKLLALGYRVIGFDARVDLVHTLEDYDGDSTTGNPSQNIDHGWTVPMAQSLILAVMKANPTRKVSLVGHSLGATVVRDSLRRLFNSHKAGDVGAVNPFAQLADVVLLSGAHHGVGTFANCANFAHMRGTVTCEMGDRAAFQPTYFSKPLNGPGDLFSTPCADGDYAYGENGQCDGNIVEYTTVTMEDLAEGSFQDEFVSEASSKLDLDDCVNNELIGLGDFDASGYFVTGFGGFIANHFGSARSNTGMQVILDAFAD